MVDFLLACGLILSVAIKANDGSQMTLIDEGVVANLQIWSNYSRLRPPPTFTLAIVFLNVNFTPTLLSNILSGVNEPRLLYESARNPFSNHFRRQTPVLPPYRLKINPINAYGLGLSKLVKNSFCSHSTQSTNALLLLVDKTPSSRNSQGIQMANILATMASYIGLPTLSWSNSASTFKLATSVTPPPLLPKLEEFFTNFASDNMDHFLLAPSVANQAKAVYGLLKRHYPDHKVAVITYANTPGVDAFLLEIRAIMRTEDRRQSLFEFDSHQMHMSSRISYILQISDKSSVHLEREFVVIRDLSDAVAFILYAGPADSDKILEEAQHFGLTAGNYVWICGKPSLGDNDENSPIPLNYIPGLIAVTYNTSQSAQLVALRTAIQAWSDGIRKFFYLTKARDLQPQQTMAPVISCNASPQAHWNNGQVLHRAIKHRLAKLTTTGDFERQNDIIFLDLQVNRIWKPIGVWSASAGVKINNQKWLHRLEKLRHPHSKSNRLRIATLEEPPFVVYEFPNAVTGHCNQKAIPCRLSPLNSIGHYNVSSTPSFNGQQQNGTLMCCVGYSMDLLRRLSQHIGFEFEVFEVYDRKWGAYDKSTNSWNGLVQALLDGSADMVVTSLKINSDRSGVIDFSVPFYETGITILVRVREGIVSAVAFLEPFSTEMWWVVFFGCVNAFALVIFLFEHAYDRLSSGDKLNGTRYSVAESIYAVLIMLFNATTKMKNPRSFATRLMTCLWSFVCVILVASFMANLAAFMITEKDYYNFSGLDDYRLKNPFTKNPAWRYATIPSGATETIMRTNFPEMHRYMRPYTQPNAAAGVEAVKRGDLDAFIYDASVLEYKVGRDRDCLLRTVGKWYALTGYGIAMPKNSGLLHAINTKIAQYQRSGYLQHLEEYWLASACKERQKRELRHSHSLSVFDLKAVFVILTICVTGCLMFLCLEHLLLRYCGRSVRRSVKRNILALFSPKKKTGYAIRMSLKRIFVRRIPTCSACNIRKVFRRMITTLRRNRVRPYLSPRRAGNIEMDAVTRARRRQVLYHMNYA